MTKRKDIIVQLSTRIPYRLKRRLAVHVVQYNTTIQRFVAMVLVERLLKLTAKRTKSKPRKSHKGH